MTPTDEHPQTYQASVGRGFYYKKKFGNDVHGVYIFGSDLRSARNGSFSSGLGQVRQICCTSDRDFDSGACTSVRVHTGGAGDQGPVVELRPERGTVQHHGGAPQGGQAPGCEHGEGVGLRHPVLRPGLDRAGGRRRRRPVCRHAVPAVLQRRGPQGEQDGGELLQERRRGQRRTARRAVLVDRGDRVPRCGERRCRRARGQRPDQGEPARRAGRHQRVRRRRLLQRRRPGRPGDRPVPRAQPGQERQVRPRVSPPSQESSTARRTAWCTRSWI